MSHAKTTPLGQIASFVAGATPPADARVRAAAAVMDTVGVAVAGSIEPAAQIVRRTLGPAGPSKPGTQGPCSVWGTPARASAPDAALANGTAAHALDYDDMCFVSLAHPSAPLVPAILAAASWQAHPAVRCSTRTSRALRFRRVSGA
jgi:2-methylcitrate dehydratase PrpD